MVSFSRRSAMAATGAAIAAVTAGAARASRAQIIPLDMRAPRPTAPLRLGGATAVTAIFDTGAAASIVMLKYARSLDLPDLGPAAASGGAGGKPVKGFRTTISGALGEAVFGPAMAVALDVPLPLLGISAIISPTVFSGRLVRLDFPKARAEVLEMTTANTPASRAHGYHGINSEQAIRSRPAVAMILPGGETRSANVDTGWNQGLGLPYAMAKHLPLMGPLGKARAVRQVGRKLKAWSGQIRGEIRVGDIALANPSVLFLEDTEEAMVGMAIMRTRVLVLDPKGLRTWLLPE